jgi:hypothetical protein
MPSAMLIVPAVPIIVMTTTITHPSVIMAGAQPTKSHSHDDGHEADWHHEVVDELMPGHAVPTPLWSSAIQWTDCAGARRSLAGLVAGREAYRA